LNLDLQTLMPAQREALRRVSAWGAVRPDLPHMPNLEALGWLKRYETVLGQGLILSRPACRVLNVSERERSDTALTTALYLQDAKSVLRAHHFTHLQPGSTPPFFTVRNAQNRSCPLLARLALRGYTQRTVAGHLKQLEGDLLVRNAMLVVVHPEPGTLTLKHDRLHLVHAPPQWG